jgi:peptide/nickel transport system ATP-binding protein
MDVVLEPLTTVGAGPVLEVEHLTQRFPLGGGRQVHALNDVSFTVAKGETVGIVGESGCGKSTLLKTILQAPPPTFGTVRFLGKDLVSMPRQDLQRVRPRLGMVFQDPYSSLDPRFKIIDLVTEPLAAQKVPKADRAGRIEELFDMVGLDVRQHGGRRAAEVSGGQLQRVAIARALALEPAILLCDEVVSALDVSVQAQVLNVLEVIRQQKDLASIFVSHDLSVVRHVSDRINVMYLGSVMEIGPADDVYEHPIHPYTGALISASPAPMVGVRPRERIVLEGDLPSPVSPPPGCSFNTRCPNAQERCRVEVPELREFSAGHFAACHFPLRDPHVTPIPVACAINNQRSALHE